MDQGSTRKRSAVHNLAPTVTKFCVMWEGQALPHDTKFGNCRCETVDRRVIFIRSLIHGSSWSGLIKAEPALISNESWCYIVLLCPTLNKVFLLLLLLREYIYTLSYHHHQIGSMNYCPLFRVRSWNNGVRCMSFHILIKHIFENIMYV